MKWFVPAEAPVCSLSMQLKSRELTKMEGGVFIAP